MAFTISLKHSGIESRMSVTSSDGQALTVTTAIEPQSRVIREAPKRMRLPVDFDYITLDRKQTAKLIREDLKRWYPLTKFSVTTELMSSGYTSIKVKWADSEPPMDEVQAFLDRYESTVSDESGDFADPVVTQIEGRWYHFGADYISCERMPGMIEGSARVIVPKLVEGSGNV